LAIIEWRAQPSEPSPEASGPAQLAPVASGESPGLWRLPRAYWWAWLALTLGIAIEFSIVYWSSSLIVIRTGADTAQSTTAAAAFVLGMIVVRSFIAGGVAAGVTQARLMSGAFAVVLIGVLGVWQAGSLALSALALFVAGLGVGPLYPVGIARALSRAPDAAIAAAARTTLASGTAIFIAPFALSLLAQVFGLVTAWLSLAAIAICGLAVVVGDRTRRPTPSA
jgi:MFS family permease